MRILQILVTSVIFLSLGCEQKQEQQIRREGPAVFNITGLPGIEYTISAIDPLNLSEVALAVATLDTAGKSTFTMDIEEPQFIQVQSSLSSNRILMLPGAEVNMSIDDDPSSFTGDLASANTAIIKLQQAEELFFEEPAYYTVDPEGFQERYNQVEKQVGRILDEVDEQDDVNRILSALADAKLMLMKKQYVLSLLEKDQQVPNSEFYRDVFAAMPRDPDLLLKAGSWEFATILHLYLEKQFITQAEQSESASTIDVIRQVQDQVENLSLPENQKAFLKAKNLMIGMSKLGRTPEIEALYNNFTSTYATSRYNTTLKAYYELWGNLSPGNPAPDIVGTTIGMDTVRLSDFKGKMVLIDVWASWCEECAADFKNIQNVKQSLNSDELVWMFYSVDQERNAWEKALEGERVPEGIHLMELLLQDEDDIWGKYLVTDLPRYIFIDREGLIIDAVAPETETEDFLNLIQQNLQQVQ